MPVMRRARLVGAAGARLFAVLERLGYTPSCYQRSRILVSVLRWCGVPANICYAASRTDPRVGHCWVDALTDADLKGWDVIAIGR